MFLLTTSPRFRLVAALSVLVATASILVRQ